MRNIFILLLAVAIAVPTAAQRNKNTKKRVPAKTTKTVDKALAEKIAQMTNATQKILFVDSVVVDKSTFLKAFRISPEAGRIDSVAPRSYIHVNEMGDKCYYSAVDSTGSTVLYTSDIIDGKTTNTTAIDAIAGNANFANANYPFMMSDGVTLYFAATGKESIGGYDIFVTRYDAETNSFLQPENIGMPFNSTANDYMYVVDDYNNIGWFATDRNQPADKVCVYAFVPTDTRETYAPDAYTPQQLKSLASLHSIADTWGDGKEREAAQERINNVNKNVTDEAPVFTFVVNDETVYHRYSDFRSKANADKFRRLQDLQKKAALLDKAVSNARDYYARSTASRRTQLSAELLRSEAQQEQYERTISALAKEIRNSENE